MDLTSDFCIQVLTAAALHWLRFRVFLGTKQRLRAKSLNLPVGRFCKRIAALQSPSHDSCPALLDGHRGGFATFDGAPGDAFTFHLVFDAVPTYW